MTLVSRVDRIERNLFRRDCTENHFRVHITRVDEDGSEHPGPEPAPCTACDGPLEVLAMRIETVPDRTD